MPGGMGGPELVRVASINRVALSMIHCKFKIPALFNRNYIRPRRKS